MSSVRLADPIISGALILSGRMTVGVLYNEGETGHGPLATRQHIVFPGPGDCRHRITGRSTFHFHGGPLQHLQRARMRHVVDPWRHCNN